MFMGVYGFAWIQAITYKVVCTRGQILGPRALCQVLAFWYIYQACYNFQLLIKLSTLFIFSDKKLGKSQLVVCKTRFYLFLFLIANEKIIIIYVINFLQIFDYPYHPLRDLTGNEVTEMSIKPKKAS